MQGGLHLQRTIPSTQRNAVQQNDVALSNNISGLLVIALPIVVICTIVAYRKRKAIVLQRRIDRLHRIWQLDTSKKLS
jgi:hypothetical protein